MAEKSTANIGFEKQIWKCYSHSKAVYMKLRLTI